MVIFHSFLYVYQRVITPSTWRNLTFLEVGIPIKAPFTFWMSPCHVYRRGPGKSHERRVCFPWILVRSSGLVLMGQWDELKQFWELEVANIDASTMNGWCWIENPGETRVYETIWNHGIFNHGIPWLSHPNLHWKFLVSSSDLNLGQPGADDLLLQEPFRPLSAIANLRRVWAFGSVDQWNFCEKKPMTDPWCCYINGNMDPINIPPLC